VVYVWAVSGGIMGGSGSGGVFRNKAVWYLLWLRVRMISPVCGRVVPTFDIFDRWETHRRIDTIIQRHPFLLLVPAEIPSMSGVGSIMRWYSYFLIVEMTPLFVRGNFKTSNWCFYPPEKQMRRDLLWRKAPFPRQGKAR
jgi:hypothetical protein